MRTICLLNDSFPPIIDGVANAVVNYAKNIQKNHGRAIVVTPSMPGADDSGYDFPVIRYPSIDTRKLFGYVAGYPFSPEAAYKLRENDTDLLHLHCPAASALLARQVRETLDRPLVLTWHTKYDIDIANALHGKLLQEGAMQALLRNVRACDEVWAVSQGAADNLHSLGYERDIVIMPNGIDLPKGAPSEAWTREVTGGYDLPEGVPVFLFVGRLMWYKGIRIILDALADLKAQGKPFRMVFVGKGTDEADIRETVLDLGLQESVLFTGPVHDREALRAWYTRADLFLFPSTFDTNGLVVREAAACGLASVLIRGSAAAEDVTDGRNAFLIEENAASMATKLAELLDHPETLRTVGAAAQDDLYLSWEDAVRNACDRYEVVIDNYKSGKYPKRGLLEDRFFKSQGDLMETLGTVDAVRRETLDYLERQRLGSAAYFDNMRDETREHLESVRAETRDYLETVRSETREHFRELRDDFRKEGRAFRDEVRQELEDIFDVFL